MLWTSSPCIFPDDEGTKRSLQIRVDDVARFGHRDTRKRGCSRDAGLVPYIAGRRLEEL